MLVNQRLCLQYRTDNAPGIRPKTFFLRKRTSNNASNITSNTVCPWPCKLFDSLAKFLSKTLVGRAIEALRARQLSQSTKSPPAAAFPTQLLSATARLQAVIRAFRIGLSAAAMPATAA